MLNHQPYRVSCWSLLHIGSFWCLDTLDKKYRGFEMMFNDKSSLQSVPCRYCYFRKKICIFSLVLKTQSIFQNAYNWCSNVWNVQMLYLRSSNQTINQQKVNSTEKPPILPHYICYYKLVGTIQQQIVSYIIKVVCFKSFLFHSLCLHAPLS